MSLSLMMFLDDLGQAIVNPTCGMEALAAQGLRLVESCYSNLTEIRYVFKCCAQQVSEIVGDLFHANAMEVYWLMFPLCVKEQLLGDLADRGGGPGGATGGALTGGVTFVEEVGAGLMDAGTAL